LPANSALPCFKQEQTAVFYVQRRLRYLWKLFRCEGERDSGPCRKVFGFVTGTAFTLPPESRSPSHRNAVHLPTGIAFGFDRIPHRQRSRRYCGHIGSQVADSTFSFGGVSTLKTFAEDGQALASSANALEELGLTPEAIADLRNAILADPRRESFCTQFVELCFTYKSYQAGVDVIDACRGRRSCI
jgi:hypothetical protein